MCALTGCRQRPAVPTVASHSAACEQAGLGHEELSRASDAERGGYNPPSNTASPLPSGELQLFPGREP